MAVSDDDGLRRRATNSIGWVVFERWSSRLISLALLALLTRLLTPADFGLISLATASLAVVQVFVDSGFSRALIQKRQIGPKDASTAFWASMSIAVTLCVALVLVAPLIATALGDSRLGPVLQVLSITLPLTALSQTPAALLERDLDFKPLSLRQFIGTLSGAAIAVPIALLGGGVWALVAQTVVSSIAATIALWASTSWRPKLEFSRVALKSLWATGASILGIDLLDAIQGNVDKIVIGIFFDPTQLGYYFLAQRIGTILIELVTSVISRVSFTTFSRVQDDNVRLNRIFRQLTFVASAISVPLFGLVAVFAAQLVGFLFGPGWQAAVPILWILAPGWALGAVMYFDRTVLLATSNSGPALMLALFQNIVSATLVFVFIPFGVIGVAFSRLARFVTWPIRLWVLHRLAGIEVWKYIEQILRPAGAFAPIILILALLQLTPWAGLPLPMVTFVLPLSVLALICFGGALYALGGPENRALVARTLGDISSRFRRR